MSAHKKPSDVIVGAPIESGRLPVWLTKRVVIFGGLGLVVVVGLVWFLIWLNGGKDVKRVQAVDSKALVSSETLASISAATIAADRATDKDAKTAAYINVANGYISINSLSQAEVYAKKAMAAGATTVSIQHSAALTLAEAYARQKKFTEAKALLTPLKQANPKAEDKAFQDHLTAVLTAYDQGQTTVKTSRPCEPTPDNKDCKQ